MTQDTADLALRAELEKRNRQLAERYRGSTCACSWEEPESGELDIQLVGLCGAHKDFLERELAALKAALEKCITQLKRHTHGHKDEPISAKYCAACIVIHEARAALTPSAEPPASNGLASGTCEHSVRDEFMYEKVAQRAYGRVRASNAEPVTDHPICDADCRHSHLCNRCNQPRSAHRQARAALEEK